MGADTFAKAFGVDAASAAASEAYRQRAFYAAGSVIPGTSGAFDFAAKAGALGGAEASAATRALGLVGRVAGRLLGPISIALTAYELFNWYKTQNKQQPASQAPVGGGGFSAGVAGKTYDVRAALTTPPGGNITANNGGGVFTGPFTVSNTRAIEQSPGSAPNYSFFYTVTGSLNGGPVNRYDWGINFLAGSPGVAFVKTFEVGSNPVVSPTPTAAPTGYAENRNAAEVAKDVLAKIAPGISVVTPPGLIPKRSPQFNPILPSPGAPNQNPGVELFDPKTGITVRTNPGTGAIEIYDPATGKTTEIWTPPGIATKPEQKQQSKDIGLIPKTCPSPCPEVDLTEVLLKIAEVKSDVSDVQDSVGFSTGSTAVACGAIEVVSSVQGFLELLDDKLGFDEALDFGERPAEAPDLCNVGQALEELATRQPIVFVVQGFEAPALRDFTAKLVFNKANGLQEHGSMTIPNPKPGLTRAQVLAAVEPVIRGDWYCSLKLDDGRELQGWFTTKEAGEAYLVAASALCSGTLQDDGFSATYRQNKGPKAYLGQALNPVKIFFLDAGNPAILQKEYDLR